MPRTVRLIEPSMSLSITRASKEQAKMLASIPAVSLIMLAPALAAKVMALAFSAPAWLSGSLESAIPAATPDGKAQVIDHLSGGGVDDRLLTAASAHRPGAEVGHERPHAHHAGMTR